MIDVLEHSIKCYIHIYRHLKSNIKAFFDIEYLITLSILSILVLIA